MNLHFISFIIGWILNFQGIFLLVPSLVALYYRETSGFAFVITAVICLVTGFLLTRKKPANKAFYAKEGFISVAACWIALSITGALPFVFSGEIPSIVDALFETVSGFTTTGASILNDVEAMSKCCIFWRSFTHWLGGMGVLVFVLCVLPLAGGDNMHIMKAESPGPSVNKLVPRVRDTAMILYGIYIVLTIIEGILLLIFGMSGFDAITTSLATAGTGGFGIKHDSMGSYSVAIQNIVAVFMMIFGVNFSIYFLILVRKPKQILKSDELRAYLGIVVLATVAIGINSREYFASIWSAFQQAFFQVTSIMTTTGFATTDFNLWPSFSKTILVLLMFTGACAGSTSGGIKVSRIVIMFKDIKNEIASFIHPRSVQTLRMDDKKVSNEVVRTVKTFFMLYLVIFATSLLLISFENFSFETNFTAVSATLNNVGPGLDGVGPMESFAKFNPFSKIILIFDMLAGRLELFPMLILFSPGIWRGSRKRIFSK
ncbi:TrkH family potassium uptake protein [Anaerosporobacter sp.]|uniref:TrkH family potassium uptake protein n=1 Tax=Anaerosporobacter sp. TaxID=1872529 RepID=UPI00286F3B35|nr:TrkH family potassium uptake protein [Anaerosporobacter sp.]